MTFSYQSHYVMVCALQGLVWADVMQDYCTVTQQDWIRLWQELVVLDSTKTMGFCIAIPLCYCVWTDVMQDGCTHASKRLSSTLVWFRIAPKLCVPNNHMPQKDESFVRNLVWFRIAPKLYFPNNHHDMLCRDLFERIWCRMFAHTRLKKIV